MNDLYNEYITRNGKQYRYDPDYDCYYAVERDMTMWEAWSPLVIILVLAAICYYLEYIR